MHSYSTIFQFSIAVTELMKPGRCFAQDLPAQSVCRLNRFAKKDYVVSIPGIVFSYLPLLCGDRLKTSEPDV